MSPDLLDQLSALGRHLEEAVSPVTVDELRATEVPIEVAPQIAELAPRRRYGRFLAIAASIAIVAAGVVVFANRGSSNAPATPPTGSGTTLAPANTHTSFPDTTSVPATTSTPGPTIPPGGLTLAYGGSVMLGAAQALAPSGVLVIAPGVAGGGITRSDQSAITAAIDSNVGSRIVILQIGDDGPIDQAGYDRLLGRLADRARVLVLTVHGPGAWFAPNNEYIRALPSRFPNVTVVDWDKAVTSGDVTGLTPDGMHLGMAARTAYATLVAKALSKAQFEVDATTTTSTTTTSPPADGSCEWTGAFTGHDGAGGHLATYVSLTNTGAHTCTLPKVAGVTVTFSPANVTVVAQPGSFFPTLPGPATVAPGLRVTLTLTTTTIAGCTVVSPPGGVATATVELSDGARVPVVLGDYVAEKCGVGYSQLGPGNQ